MGSISLGMIGIGDGSTKVLGVVALVLTTGGLLVVVLISGNTKVPSSGPRQAVGKKCLMFCEFLSSTSNSWTNEAFLKRKERFGLELESSKYF